MAKCIGVVYGTKSGIVRRIICPDDDNELSTPGHLGPGESIHQLEGKWDPDEDYTPYIENLLGRIAPSSRCVIINKGGQVINVLVADPEIDSHPDGEVVQHDTACIGWYQIENGYIVPESDVS